MRRPLLLGLLAALPLVAVPFVWGAASGGAGDGSLTEFREVGSVAAPLPASPIESVAATPTRVSLVLGRPAGVEVVIRDDRGRTVHRLGHYTLAGRQRLVLRWDGLRLPAGLYVAVARAGGETARSAFRVGARS